MVCLVGRALAITLTTKVPCDDGTADIISCETLEATPFRVQSASAQMCTCCPGERLGEHSERLVTSVGLAPGESIVHASIGMASRVGGFSKHSMSGVHPVMWR